MYATGEGRTGVVGMLYDGHQLDNIVAMIFDALQDIRCKFFAHPQPGFRSRDNNVRFVSVCILGKQKVGNLIIIRTASHKARVTSHGRNMLAKNISNLPESGASHHVDLNGGLSSCVFKRYEAEQKRGDKPFHLNVNEYNT